MQILLFMPDLAGGGAQRTFVNLANSFAASGHDVTLCVARGVGPGCDWLAPSVKLADLACGRTRNAVRPLARMIAKVKPDAVLATIIDANIVAFLAHRLARSPARLYLRETNSHRMRDDLGPVTRFLGGMVYRRVDKVIALSRGVGDELAADYGLPPDRIAVIHNPIDTAEWRHRAEEARKAPPPWVSFGGEAPVLLAVGRLTRQKGYDLLLRAVARCTGAGREARVVIVGEGPDRKALSDLARELGIESRILMPGFVPDPASWYAHAQAFVLSSRWEGFGHVIVESMACSVPVIAFDCPHGPADILGQGKGGILVPPGDIDLLATSIDRLLGNSSLRQSMATAAREAAECFSSNRVATQYQQLIEPMVLNGKSPVSSHVNPA